MGRANRSARRPDRRRTTSEGRRRRPSGGARPPSSGGTRRAWLSGQGPLLRFLTAYILLAIGFNLFFYGYFTNTVLFQRYLAATATVSAVAIRALGVEAASAAGAIDSSRLSISIKAGCDGLQPIALFLIAIVLAPASLRSKFWGVITGGLLLLALNITRIVTLFLAGTYFRSAFEAFHIEVWQGLFILITLGLWIAWARWALMPVGARDG